MNSKNTMVHGITTTIKKASILKEEFLSVTYTTNMKEGAAGVDVDCPARMHEDLRAKFAAYAFHLASLCGQYNSDGDLVTSMVNCTGFAISGKMGAEGIVLTGRRALENGKSIVLNTPFTLWDPQGEDPYPHIKALIQLTGEIQEEVDAYLFKGKHAPEPQLELDLPDPEDKDSDDLGDQLPGADGQEPLDNFYRDPALDAKKEKKKRAIRKKKGESEI